jgi:hypothetical protein
MWAEAPSAAAEAPPQDIAMPNRTYVMAAIGALVVLVAAQGAPAWAPGVATISSCTASATATTCHFSCWASSQQNGLNQATVYWLGGNLLTLESGSASCGGQSVTQSNCPWTSDNSCTAASDIIHQDDSNGTCTWLHGDPVTCANVFQYE